MIVGSSVRVGTVGCTNAISLPSGEIAKSAEPASVSESVHGLPANKSFALPLAMLTSNKCGRRPSQIQ